MTDLSIDNVNFVCMIFNLYVQYTINRYVRQVIISFIEFRRFQITNPAMRRFERVFRVCARNVPKQRAKINPQMSALLSAEDAL
jgi:hypothetical protein